MRWFFVIALVACGKSKATCKAEVADLMTLFRTMDRTPPMAVPADMVRGTGEGDGLQL